MIPVHVIAGFLGAGKTTTLLHLLRQRPDERVAIVVNDFGTGKLDESALGAFAVAEIHGACVCCTAPHEFVRTLQGLIDAQTVDRIFVEPTGLGRPADIVDTLRRGPIASRVSPQGVVVVIDPAMISENQHSAIILEQLAAADIVIVNRNDVCTPEQRAVTEGVIAELWPAPSTVVFTDHGQVRFDVLFSTVNPHPHTHHAHVSTAGYYASTETWPSDVVFSRSRVAELFANSPAVRIKGVFRTDEGVFRIERAGSTVHAAASEWRNHSVVDVLHTGGHENPREWLNSAILSEAERAVRGDAVEVAWPAQRRSYDRFALLALADGVDDVSLLFPKRRGRAARFSALVAHSGVPSASDVVFTAVDGMTTPPVPLASLSDAVLVCELAGEALPPTEGGPIRLLGGSGPCANVKGIARIVFYPREVSHGIP